MALPPEARAPKPKKVRKRKKPYTRPPTARSEVTTDRPRTSAPVKKGPPSPQRTGHPVTKQPITRKKGAAPTQTDTTSSASRTPAQKRRDRAASNRNIREARRRALNQPRPSGMIDPRKLPHPESPLVIANRNAQLATGLRQYGERGKREQAIKVAPVLTALEQTTRPLHGVAAGTQAAITGKNVPSAVKRGLQNKQKTTFSDVLKSAGVKNKTIRGVAGFALDVGLDPTTYVTGGTGSVAAKSAASAARKAEAKALAKGLDEKQAAKFGERAAKQAIKKAPEGKGVTIRAGGREVPGVRRATAKTAQVVSKATDKPKVVKRVKDTTRHLAADVNPNIKPDNISRADYETVRQATRTTRSSTAREIHKVKQRSHAVRKALGKDDQAVLDAIESKTIHKLPEHLRAPAKRLDADFKHARRLERTAGIPVKKREGYVPHALAGPLEKGEGIRSVGQKTISPSFAKGRKEQRTLKEIRQTDPGKYSEDAALLHANRLIESHVAVHKAKLNRRLLDVGRRVRKGDTVQISDGEKVFRIVGSDIKPVEKAELQKFVNTGDGGKGGQYVILNEQTVNRAVANTIPNSERSTIGELIDRGQGGWKWLATVPNPGFHLRNLIGDTGNAYLAESAPRLARNIGQAGKALKHLGKQEESLRTLSGHIDPSGKGLKIKGKTVSYDDLIREAEQVGAIRSGFINKELPELTRNQAAGVGKASGRQKITQKIGDSRTARTAGRALQNREDLMRLATYIGGRKRGLSPEQAAARMAKYHFDYADLTSFERSVMRRVMPFYTFSARNIPLQFKSFFAKPGKFAQYQKIREEVAKAFGLNLDDVEDQSADYEQRSAPVYAKWKGKKFTISLGPSGLPLTDLNELPVSGDPLKAADEWMDRAMSLVTPIGKTPVELWANFSFFFRDQIERDTGPLVAAPSWVGTLPKSVREDLGVVPDYKDSKTGKQSWGWPAKVDYVAHILPGPANYINRLMTPSDRKGQTTAGKTLAYAGVRVTPLDPVTVQINDAYTELNEVQKQIRALNQRGIYKDNANGDYHKLDTRQAELQASIDSLKGKRGDVGRRKKLKVSKPASSPGSSSSSGGGLFDNSSSGSSGGGLFGGG